MLELVFSNRFKKDLKIARKRGYNLDQLGEIIEKLQRQEPLPEKNHDHPLRVYYVGFRECHILPDWLLIYRVDNGELICFLSRTGTHSDLFG